MKMVRSYLPKIQLFGPVGFEIAQGKPLPQGGFVASAGSIFPACFQR
jgi:hypothetical protein